MKCENAEQMILLADSGELDQADTVRLEQHLAECANCTAYRKSMLKITGLARQAISSAGPSEATRLKIHAAAAREIERPAHTLWNPLLQILAYAAVLAIAVTVWFLAKPQISQGNGLAQRIDSTHAIVSMLTPQDTQYGVPKTEKTDSDKALRALSENLLRLEGLSEDLLSSENSFFEPGPEA